MGRETKTKPSRYVGCPPLNMLSSLTKMVVLWVTRACKALEAFLGTLVNVCLVSLAGVAIKLTLMLSWWPLHVGSIRSGMQDSKLDFWVRLPNRSAARQWWCPWDPSLCHYAETYQGIYVLWLVWASLIRCERVIAVLIGWPSKGLLIIMESLPNSDFPTSMLMPWESSSLGSRFFLYFCCCSFLLI